MLHKCTNSQVTKNAITILNKASIVSGSTSSVQKRFKVTLPDLPYDYGALEPVISAEIMQLHHSKHHQTYVNNFNVAAEKLAEAVETGNEVKVEKWAHGPPLESKFTDCLIFKPVPTFMMLIEENIKAAFLVTDYIFQPFVYCCRSMANFF